VGEAAAAESRREEEGAENNPCNHERGLYPLSVHSLTLAPPHEAPVGYGLILMNDGRGVERLGGRLQGEGQASVGAVGCPGMAKVEPVTQPASDLLEEAAAVGGTPAVQAANAALRAFSKAARAFTLYDAQNEAVRRFLQDYRDALNAFLGTHGTLDLEVRPFELALRGEVVHAEKDREKSLASRLYRDGIRRLTIQPGATWEEELKLLEVVSVRFIGVRQQEEDVVTLLTRAAFRSISFASVGGLVESAQDDPDGAVRPHRRSGRSFPADFDGPPPPVLPPRQFGYFEIPRIALEGFQAEEPPEALPGNAVRMVRELLDDADKEEMKTLVPAVEEVRDFLLAEMEIKHLRDLARVVAGQHGRAAATLGPALKPLAAPYTLQKLLATVPPGEEAPDALVELLDLLVGYGADLLDPLLDRIDKALASGAANPDPALETLARRAARGKKERLLARLSTAGPALVDVLLRFLRAVEPAAGQEAGKQLLASNDLAARLAGVRLLDEAGAGEETEAALIAALESDAVEVRIAAAEVLALHLGKKAFSAIQDQVVARDAVGLEELEAEAMGVALAVLAPSEARELFTSWIRPPQATGLLSRLVARKPRRMLAWTAAAGLVHVPGEPTLELLREIAAQAQSDEELKRRCLKSIAFWRRGAKANG